MVGDGSREGWMALRSGTLITGVSVLEVVLENEIGLAPSLCDLSSVGDVVCLASSC